MNFTDSLFLKKSTFQAISYYPLPIFMRRKNDIKTLRLNQGYSGKYPALFLYSLLFGVFLIPFQHSHAQNANERDIQLPVPSDENLPTIYLIGDSTVRNGSGDGSNGQWGWGSLFHEWFKLDEVNVVNRAIGGRSSRTYQTQGYWDQQKKLLKPGDYVLIQFGHNDASPVDDSSRARGVLDGIGYQSVDLFNQLTKEDETVFTYGEYIRTFIKDIKAAGATPIICSPVPTKGTVLSKLVKYDTWAEQVAATEGVYFIDLYDIISEAYSTLNPDELDSLFDKDRVHTTYEGAKFSSKLVVAGLKGMVRNPLQIWLNSEGEDITSAHTISSSAFDPIVKGYGENHFTVGKLLYENSFTNPDDWHIQTEKTPSKYAPRVDFRNNTLEVLMPGRGATIWNKQEFSGNITITYNVKAPSTYVSELGIAVRDINNFWHATHPDQAELIFDDTIYDGAFPSYHTLNGYYTSIGGRDNTTTRMRRYPRMIAADAVSHISLTERDEQLPYLIQPDKMHFIQVVVFEDLVQYLVNGEVFYEIKSGDLVQVTHPNGSIETQLYDLDLFPPYSKGWFGFRLVNTHHIYSDFKVHALESLE